MKYLLIRTYPDGSVTNILGDAKKMQQVHAGNKEAVYSDIVLKVNNDGSTERII